MKELFGTNQSKAVLAKFMHKIDGLVPSDNFETQRNSFIRLVIGSMENDPDQWNELCQININWIGNQFINRLAGEEKQLNKEKLDPESVNKCCQRCWLEISTLFFENPGDFRPENFQLKDNCRFASSENRLFAVFRRTTPRNAA